MKSMKPAANARRQETSALGNAALSRMNLYLIVAIIALCLLTGCKPSAQSCAKRADAKYRSGDLAGAISEYSEAIRAKPGFESAYVRRGIARAKMGDADGAIADFTEALRLNPKDAV